MKYYYDQLGYFRFRSDAKSIATDLAYIEMPLNWDYTQYQIVNGETVERSDPPRRRTY
tara:strand:- start:6639 stop:6812 length:174 start_codon:yes stop_codon:yes gene_type:complete